MSSSSGHEDKIRAANEAALAALRSLGPVSARMLIEAGVPNVRALRRLGPLESYRRLRFHFGKRVTLNFLYALDCAIAGRDWRTLSATHKAELKQAALEIDSELTALSRGSSRT
jgi:DNA transformation protein